MCTPSARRLVRVVIAAVLTGCGGEDLTLPGNGGPAALTAVSGQGQEGTVGSRLDEPLIARVTGSDSRPLAGILVEFGFQNDVPGAQVDPAEAVTDAEGRATAQVRLGESIGSQTVEAQVAEAAAPSLRATFALTAVAEDQGKKDKGKKDKGNGGGGQGDDDDDDDDDHDD